MAQDPYKVDQLQIAPGSGTTLKIYESGSELVFMQGSTTLSLTQLAGTGTISNVFVVGSSGAGAQYTSIQTALDQIPTSSSSTSPNVVVVYPGVYSENLVINRNGVRLVGIGRPTIQSALESTPDAVGCDNTVTIAAGGSTVPQDVIIENFKITNSHTNKSCVRVVGGSASNVGLSGIHLKDCVLEANSVAGNRTVWASSVNTVVVDGCNLGGASSSSLTYLLEVADFQMKNSTSYAVSFRWDNSGILPSQVPVGYSFQYCPRVGVGSLLTPFEGDLVDGSSLSVLNSVLDNVVLSGNQSGTFDGVTFGSLTLNDTFRLSATRSRRGSVASNPTAILTEDSLHGEVAFSSENSKDVTFEVPQVDDSYMVVFDLDSSTSDGKVPWVSNRSDTGFTIHFTSNETLTVRWRVVR